MQREVAWGDVDDRAGIARQASDLTPPACAATVKCPAHYLDQASVPPGAEIRAKAAPCEMKQAGYGCSRRIRPNRRLQWQNQPARVVQSAMSATQEMALRLRRGFFSADDGVGMAAVDVLTQRRALLPPRLWRTRAAMPPTPAPVVDDDPPCPQVPHRHFAPAVARGIHRGRRASRDEARQRRGHYRWPG